MQLLLHNREGIVKKSSIILFEINLENQMRTLRSSPWTGRWSKSLDEKKTQGQIISCAQSSAISERERERKRRERERERESRERERGARERERRTERKKERSQVQERQKERKERKKERRVLLWYHTPNKTTINLKPCNKGEKKTRPKKRTTIIFKCG